MFKRILMVWVFSIVSVELINQYQISQFKTDYKEYKNVTRDMIKTKSIPKEYILAMIAIHECINLAPQDAKFIIQASLNRERLNWGGYGDIYSQILSPEYKGLIDKNFYFDPRNKKHIQAYETACQVLKKDVTHHTILGWVHFKNDTDRKFLNKVKNRCVNLSEKTHHKFWVWKNR